MTLEGTYTYEPLTGNIILELALTPEPGEETFDSVIAPVSEGFPQCEVKYLPGHRLDVRISLIPVAEPEFEAGEISQEELNRELSAINMKPHVNK